MSFFKNREEAVFFVKIMSCCLAICLLLAGFFIFVIPWKKTPGDSLCAEIERAPFCETEVDYGPLLASARKAGFAEISPNVTEHKFPVAGQDKKKAVFKLTPYFNSDWSVFEKKIDACGYRFGRIEELVAWKKSCAPGDGISIVVELGTTHLRSYEKKNEFVFAYKEENGAWSLGTSYMGYYFAEPVRFLITEK